MTTLGRCLMLLAPAVLTACGAPSVFVLHAPLQPSSAQTVTYTARATDRDGITSIEIWEDRQTLGTCANGMQCATRVSTTRLQTCPFNPPQRSAQCAFATTAPYPDGSFVGYRATATNARGNSATDGWIYYAAGAFPWPQNPIPIYATGDPGKKIDLVFVPDSTYPDMSQFTTDYTQLVTEGLLDPTKPWAPHVFGWRGVWNLYVTYETGTARQPGQGGNVVPGNWSALRALVDTGTLVHPAYTVDYCSGFGYGNLASVQAGGVGTVVHENGHCVFGLADEYCCNGGYAQILPHANVFSSLQNCQADATANGYPPADCRQIADGAGNTVPWWRADGPDDIMIGDIRPFGRADQARVLWMYLENCAGAPGC